MIFESVNVKIFIAFQISSSLLAVNLIYKLRAQTSIIKNRLEAWYMDPLDQNFLFLHISDAPFKLSMNLGFKFYTLYLKVIKVYSIS